jgi:hypothetical protein
MSQKNEPQATDNMKQLGLGDAYDLLDGLLFMRMDAAAKNQEDPMLEYLDMVISGVETFINRLHDGLDAANNFVIVDFKSKKAA